MNNIEKIEHFYTSTTGENWFDYQEVYTRAVLESPNEAHFVEVGTWKGRSACYMGVEIVNSGKKIKFDCVDTWKFVPEQGSIPEEKFKEDIYNVFLENIRPIKHVINPVREVSWVAADKYPPESLDFIFIDATHSYASVKNDISAWLPKLKKTGLMAGHDYFLFGGVKKAVDELLGFDNLEFTKTCWILRRRS